jgi:hypothetical protein
MYDFPHISPLFTPPRLDGPTLPHQGLGEFRRMFNMRIKSLIAAAAAASMAAAPVVAAPKPVEVAPQSETVEGEQIRGGFLLPLEIIIAIIIGVLLLTDDDDGPTSP